MWQFARWWARKCLETQWALPEEAVSSLVRITFSLVAISYVSPRRMVYWQQKL
ncbi:hypothetical protein BRCON_0110 [Candidatus Sumerlaea chitinivorans]|uniref:Uncharacterized protein n=1 Tax=Sumerlaea chitinivorans TaxID=2250252 RepID=A0A2Z4Y128_SUMC1|nr:hypothetical protein BRCON_0110 [Candidatus Sumerlaea chitinivorans]